MKRKLIYILLCLLIFSQPVLANDLSNENYVKVAIIDTGISTKAINAERIIEGYNYINKNNDTEDIIGHGTAIAGVIAGLSYAGLSEASSSIKLVPLVFQTMDEDGKMQRGNSEMIARAIRDAIDKYGCRVINLSVGTTYESKLLSEAVEYAEEKNAVIISSVGNKNIKDSDSLYFPAAYPTVIGVGSVNKNGRVSYFSQRNRSLMLVAPGERIWTISKNGKALLTSGTSFAAAFVSAAAAELLSMCPGLTAADVRDILCQSATDILEPGYDTDSGWGILNLDKALTFTLEDKDFLYSVP